MLTESFDPKEQLINISNAAVNYFLSKIDSTADANAIRFSVKRSGCTGYMYDIDLVSEAKPDDMSFTIKKLPIVIDKEALTVLQGLEIDYVTEGLNRTIKFINPNAKDYCGCGESFSIK